jgi:hypothetical protein
MKVTQIEQVRQANASVKLQVLNLLGWDELQYGEFQESSGLAYLKHWFGEIPLINDLPNHRVFWNWWVIHWVERDREFLEMSGLLFRHELASYYKELHDPVSIPFRPHSAVMADTWHSMIHRLIKEAVK